MIDSERDKAKEKFMRHPFADFIMDRIFVAIHPLLEEIEELEQRLEGSRHVESIGLLKEDAVREALRRAARVLGAKKIRKIISKKAGVEKFADVDPTHYSALLAAVDKAVIKHNRNSK